MPDTRILAYQSTYRCRHRNRCCTSGWPIEIERPQYLRLRQALTDRTIAPTGTDAGVESAVSSPTADAPPILAVADRRCVFCDDATGGSCRIHRTLGHDGLPLACRQFPRLVVSDPRGVSITLSHYCPTVADLLETEAPKAVVINAALFPSDGEYVGLSADPHLPPLLHPTLAMDWESWWLCETLAVDLCLTADHPELRLAVAIERLRTWQVGPAGTVPLSTHVRDAFAAARRAPVHAPVAVSSSALRAAVLASVPERWRGEARAALQAPSAGPVSALAKRRFIAAHVLANWTAYLGEGLRAWGGSILAAASLLDVTGDPGRVDLVLRHLADSSALVAHWNRLETVPLTQRP